MELFDLLLYKSVVGGDPGGGGGGDITLRTLNVSQNGTTNAPSGTAYNKVVANVPNSYAASDEGKVVDDGALVSQTTETISQNGVVDTTTVSEVTVNVPNTYTASDEGKVVSNGSLVSQTAHAEVVANGTIDTTLNNSVVVNVPQGSTPTGTKQISITENGTTTEDVAAYANAEITVNVQSSGWDTVSIARNQAPSGRVAFNDAITIEYSALSRRPITSLFTPNASITYGGLATCTLLETAVFNGCLSVSQFAGCTSLRAVEQLGGITGAEFQNCSQLNTLVFRAPYVTPIANLNAISGTPFASGRSGGTIYIPKALYDHLGDGTSLDYKTATNWSTIDGYGTITWAQIEGSIYETQYVDGTPIPTT